VVPSDTPRAVPSDLHDYEMHEHNIFYFNIYRVVSIWHTPGSPIWHTPCSPIWHTRSYMLMQLFTYHTSICNHTTCQHIYFAKSYVRQSHTYIYSQSYVINACIINIFSSREYISHTCQTHKHASPKITNKHVITQWKDRNKVMPLPRQASTIKTRSTPQFYNSRFLKYKQRTINKILPTYPIETKLVL
jgi:hypothetical protein